MAGELDTLTLPNPEISFDVPPRSQPAVLPATHVPKKWDSLPKVKCDFGLPQLPQKPQPGTYANTQARRRTVGIPREKLTDELVKRFYINEQGVFITRLNTDVLCFKSDLKNPLILDKKIDRAISYTAEFEDVEALNALRYISKLPPGSTVAPQAPAGHVALGLYLYLADECSRLGKDKTFLSAMRDADAERNLDNPQSPAYLLDHTMHALRILGMEESHGNILREWSREGSFTVLGEKNGLNGHGGVTGAYATIARDMALRKPLLGMNLPISYALGNRPLVEGRTPEQIYNMTKELAQPTHKAEVNERIARGDALRKSRLRDFIIETMSAYPDSATSPEEANIIARKILALLPIATLEIMFRKEYSIDYATEGNLTNSYPKGHIPGVRDSTSDMARISVGSVNPRHRTIFAANGYMLQKEPDENVRLQSVAHTMLHESMHMLVGQLPKSQVEKLKAAVAAVHEELISTPVLPTPLVTYAKTMDKRSIAQRLNKEHEMYKNYSH